MSATVKKLGKRPIVWEGFERGGKVPKDSIVMAWRNWYYRADHLLEDGYTVINCPWWLGCDWDDWNLYMCNFIWLERTNSVLGATSVHWEQPGDTALRALRGDRLPWRNERTWNIDTRRKSDDLKRRLLHTDAVLDRLLCRFTFEAEEAAEPRGSAFRRNLRLTFPPVVRGDAIRYTLDGTEPSAASPACTAPFSFDKSTTVKARWFDDDGKPRGYTFAAGYTKVDYEKNLTTGKPVTSSSCGWQEKNEFAVDGLVEVVTFESTFWGAGPAPQWLMVDLEKTVDLGEVRLHTYWGDGRYYQYVIELSVDGKTWTKVADGSANTTLADANGYRHTFPATAARFVRATMLKNSVNPGMHIVELRAYETRARASDHHG